MEHGTRVKQKKERADSRAMRDNIKRAFSLFLFFLFLDTK